VGLSFFSLKLYRNVYIPIVILETKR